MISKDAILRKTAYLFVFMCILNILAIKGLWYYLFWYFDMPMHFLGGLASVFLLAYWFYGKFSGSDFIWQILCLVLVVGIGWEIFEYIFLNWYGGEQFKILDSLSDMCFDMAGGIIGVIYLKNKKYGN